ncbi:DUF3040 domain-containing protein [Kocuria rhizophila]|uniref:Hypothetical membrane protein n=1 Tax=Kocuria rhizophila (strain ATCC 9341 / DSM 348 / NBRC 103217 / DC2201) TaxID=378753 RepID=B2GJQ8_KOCRD|nr:DUF3040 domain-containing protein [Kocuria rhizophila]ASE10303.1 DUF3040 domain-containing protein [Kocuria rhizophila]MCC5672177.1 DUF3040 domain-containing protein [Kocuria rhizophila]MCC5674924.1 DUF3040 domain-containing protein [Kocuria rhizophila]VEH74886.1 Protein of uncharacterised function (DUF3040) [Kocuria rhizophila]BAG29839.1 hypothetical membrane protein [Kocuria rhizophila DC2201]
MPLSEHEQQLLAQLEKQLHEDDPRFASSMHTETVQGRGSMRNVVLGVVLAVVGLGVLLAGVSTQLIVVGVLGFVVMAGGTYVATIRSRTARGATGPSAPTAGGSGPAPKKKSSTFLQGLEDKWDRRNQGGL